MRVYQFSRSIYRELAPYVLEDSSDRSSRNHQRVLRACETAVERLATDRDYFARPARSLFHEVRAYFPMCSQLLAYEVIRRHIELASRYVDLHVRAGMTFDGAPLSCNATTRKGAPCQRDPLPGAKYCPSHKHLEDDLRVAAAA